MDTLHTGFHTLVSTLTGVGLAKVQDADEQADYVSLFRERAGHDNAGYAADGLVILFLKVAEQSSAAAAVSAILSGNYDALPSHSPLPFSKLTRALSFFVLTGMWSPTCSPEDGVIPSMDAYTESLIWLIAQTHPVGYSNMASGSWATPPDALSKFIGT